MASKTKPQVAPVDINEEAMNAELQAKVDALQAQLDEANTAKAALEASNAEANEATAKELESLKGEVQRLTNEVATRDAEIADLKANQKSVGEQAAALAAGMGIDPNGQTPSEPEETAAQKFAKLEGPEAVAFWRANRREILATISIS